MQLYNHLLLVLALVPGLTASSCRCFPGDSCWPTSKEWQSFNTSLSGKLEASVPLGSVCHSSGTFSAYNGDACDELRDAWQQAETHYESSSSPMSPWFTNLTCSPFTAADTPCTIGSLVRYAVKVESAADVQKTMKFARKHNIRLVIRNTGHDYLGKSTGAGALAIWTHHLKDTEYHPDYAASWYSGPAMRLGAGVQGFEALDAATAVDKTLVVGSCPSVGVAGGYSQGGGHGQLSSRYGLAADQVLEWEVVTASGKVLTATPEQNADLYWALSGGGAGTFAIVLSMTVKLFPELPTVSGSLSFTSTSLAGAAAEDPFWSVVDTFLLASLPLIDGGGVAVWSILADATGHLLFGLQPMALPGGGKEELQSYLKPVLQELQQHNMTYSHEINSFPTFHKSYSATVAETFVGAYHMGGRLISRATVTSKTSALISAFQNMSLKPEDGVAISGISVNASRPSTNSDDWNAVNPIWRDAALSVVLGVPFDQTDRAINLERQAFMTDKLIPQLAALDVGGAYLNEADPNQPDWQSVFYGSNYGRLALVKDKYDAEDLLYAPTAVGAERWTERVDGRLCRS